MSFLGDIGDFFSGAVNTVVNTVTNPAKLTTAILTGGVSVVSPNTFKPLTNAVQQTLYNPKLLPAVAGLAGGGLPASIATSSLLRGGQPAYTPQDLRAIQQYTGGATLVSYPTPPPQPSQGATPMGLDLSGILGTVSSIFGGNQNPVFQGVSNVAGFAQNFLPAPQPVAQPVAARMPTLPAAGMLSRLPAIGRSFFQKYPNLATAMQALRNQGRNIKRSQLYSLLKRFGPDFLIAGGILSAAAVSELMVAGPGRRRMNPGNVKALRRSLRRLESFHHLCQRADKLRRPRGRSRKGQGSASTFVRQG